MFCLKKLFLGIVCSGFLFGILGNGVISEAAEVENVNETAANLLPEDDEFYYVIDDNSGIQTRTWAKTQSYKITKGSRTYLGTYTTNRKSTISVTVKAGPAVVNLKNEYSESGKFKKYKQNCTITVTYKRYRKVDNKYVDTKTVTSNTSYTDYERI
ncbi:LMxysn_1693 family intestinal colonization protein [Candidatus Enterococcus lemimoniae]|uniref:LMxysn_1693 family intestinal colonization protein n=1 Tax=Candidatus Enterococcus lemimoniae TaxID=1834167 RepID=UPI003BB1FC61